MTKLGARWSVLCGVMAAMQAPGPSMAEEEPAKPQLAVMPLQGQGVAAETLTILDELVLNAVDDVGTYAVTGASDVKAMLEVSAQKMQLGCDEASCLTEVAGALGVRLVLTGTVAKLGDEVIITLKLLNMEAGHTLQRSQVSIDEDETLYAGAAKRAVQELIDADNLRARLAVERAQQRSFTQTLAWIGTGGAVALTAVAATLWAVRPDPTVAYDSYQAGTEPNEIAARYRSVKADVDEYNTLTYAGWFFLAAGVGAGVFAVYEFSAASELEPTTEVGVGIGAGQVFFTGVF